MHVSSTAFQDGTAIPKQFSGDGKDVSPPLRWSEVPAETMSFALICDDPDAPRNDPWVHWVLFNLPGNARGLGEAVPAQGKFVNGALQGKNDFGNLGYGGPAPPRGKPHRYFFKLYALDAPLSLRAPNKRGRGS
jgi:Raf kinase inhibitor-like YbhB/YbcL family protein